MHHYVDDLVLGRNCLRMLARYLTRHCYFNTCGPNQTVDSAMKPHTKVTPGQTYVPVRGGKNDIN